MLKCPLSGENHGDHQAAGVIATEAFDWAELVWEGKIDGISIGKICLKVAVKQWTLPQ